MGTGDPGSGGISLSRDSVVNQVVEHVKYAACRKSEGGNLKTLEILDRRQ